MCKLCAKSIGWEKAPLKGCLLVEAPNPSSMNVGTLCITALTLSRHGHHSHRSASRIRPFVDQVRFDTQKALAADFAVNSRSALLRRSVWRDHSFVKRLQFLVRIAAVDGAWFGETNTMDEQLLNMPPPAVLESRNRSSGVRQRASGKPSCNFFARQPYKWVMFRLVEAGQLFCFLQQADLHPAE